METEPSLDFADLSGPVYDALGVDITASSTEIVNAYRRLARDWHPDKHCGDEGAKIVFQEIVRAYQILMNPEARELHDLEFGCLDSIVYIQDYLLRYFYMLFSIQGLGLQVNKHKSQYEFAVQLTERLTSSVSA